MDTPRTTSVRVARWARRLLAEPALQFLVAGALLFLAHRLAVGDPRIVTITPALRADLARRFRDHRGRPPTAAELEQSLTEWKRDEALYREALREHLDRDDATVRSVLADKLRARAALGVRNRTPSDAELAQWLQTHRGLYETPLPSPAELRPRLIADFKFDAEQRAVESEVRRIVERYRFEERR